MIEISVSLLCNGHHAGLQCVSCIILSYRLSSVRLYGLMVSMLPQVRVKPKIVELAFTKHTSFKRISKWWLTAGKQQLQSNI